MRIQLTLLMFHRQKDCLPVKTDTVFYEPFNEAYLGLIRFTLIIIIALRSWHQEETVEAWRLIGTAKATESVKRRTL